MPFPLTPEVNVGSQGSRSQEESLTTVLYQREGGYFKENRNLQKATRKEKN